MGRKFGFSWSWRRASGLSAMKGKLSREIGIPLTRSGRERKLGRLLMGGSIPLMVSGNRSARGTKGWPMIIAVCPYCGHQQQIRATTIGAVKKCVACGQKFRPEVKQASFGWRTVFAATVAMIAFGLWYMRTPEHPSGTSPINVDSQTATIKRSTLPVAAAPPPKPPTPAATGPSLAERRRAAIAALYSRSEYVAAKKRADDLSEAVEAARADPEHPHLATLSQEWINAKSELARLEAEATHDLN